MSDLAAEIDAGDDHGTGPLALVTRPEPQAGEWVSKLRARGVRARALPLIVIAPTPRPAEVSEMFRSVASAASASPLVMFVSPNAALRFFECLGLADGAAGWPAGVTAGATGPGTVAALKAAGVPAQAIVAPDADAGQFDSEALWAVLRHQSWVGRPAWIVRGDGGRDWFAQTLCSAGAQVAFVQSYSRQPPVLEAAQARLLAWALERPDEARWLLSSSESVDHLAGLAPGAVWSLATALASHPRIAQRARALGFGGVVELRPTVDAVVDAMRSTTGMGMPMEKPGQAPAR